MIKICGIRRAEDINFINEFRPDFMGMILSNGFKRTIELSSASKLLKRLDKNIKRTGVFVNESAEKIAVTAKDLSLDAVQLHGNEDALFIKALRQILPEKIMIWKAVRIREKSDIEAADLYGCDYLLLDSYVKGKAGGTGVTADWELIKSTKINTPFFLAGGISEDNISDALKISGNIDLSGSVETDGVKDREKIRRIMEIYRKRI